MIFKADLNQEFYTDERCFIKEIINSERFPEVSLAQARVEPGVTTQLHILSVDEIYYILKGKGLMEINGKKNNEIGVGDAAYIKAGETQRITNLLTSDLLFLCICVPKFKPEAYTSLEK